jgi:hypothetical protein
MKIDQRIHFPALATGSPPEASFERAVECRERLIRRTREARAAELRRAREAEVQRSYDQD